MSNDVHDPHDRAALEAEHEGLRAVASPDDDVPAHETHPRRVVDDGLDHDESDGERTQALPTVPDEPTEVIHAEHVDPTVALPVDTLADDEPKPGVFRAPLIDHSLFRPREDAEPLPEAESEPTAVMPADQGEVSSDEPQGKTPSADDELAAARAEQSLLAEHEEKRRADERARRLEAEAARQRALGVVAPVADAEPLPTRPPRRYTDKALPALGLFLTRLVLAGILGIRGYQILTDIPGTRDLLDRLGLPYLEYAPWALGVAHMLAAVALLFGFAVRLTGLCVAALAICVLALVKWGAVPVFQSGMPGFVGELELLIAAVGLQLLLLGGGGWGIDGGIRRNRQREKYGR